MLNKERKDKLFDMLINFGFNKIENDNYIIFKQFINNKEEVFVYPKTELSINHYASTRHHLDWNGWIDKKNFNKMFDL